MNLLVTANFTHHPTRTLASITGIAIGTILVVLTVGLVRGLLRDRGQRDANLGVELMLSATSQGGISFTTMPVSLPIAQIADMRNIPGVKAATPVAQHIELGGHGLLGLRQIDGVNFADYQQTTGVRIVAGAPLPALGDALVVDVKYAAITQTKIGDKLKLLDREFTVVGIYAPETGARMMIPLQTMQTALGTPGMCSMFLVKCANSDEQEAIAHRIAARFPDLRVLFTRDLPRMFATGFIGFNTFLNAVAVLAATISLLIALLTSYTTVAERTQQIGVLKSLGASRRFIALIFLKESLLVSGCGVLCGLALSLLVRNVLIRWYQTRISLEGDYIAFAVVGGLCSSLLGALYPALRAARQDAVQALSYE